MDWIGLQCFCLKSCIIPSVWRLAFLMQDLATTSQVFLINTFTIFPAPAPSTSSICILHIYTNACTFPCMHWTVPFMPSCFLNLC
uniref:G-protein coupled receptors family 1 profile domain-containing protein n=1 Tax=Octopus bimaculoides TaxID=37653 RepID=A0A0L8I734_OCTBM